MQKEPDLIDAFKPPWLVKKYDKGKWMEMIEKKNMFAQLRSIDNPQEG